MNRSEDGGVAEEIKTITKEVAALRKRYSDSVRKARAIDRPATDIFLDKLKKSLLEKEQHEVQIKEVYQKLSNTPIFFRKKKFEDID